MRYIIGIDLGTTNSCVSYVDTEDSKLSIQPFRIPQLTALGGVDSLATLPSFCYLAATHEWPKGALDLPWRSQSDDFVGRFAQEQGAKVSTRVIQSAKSWLCHAAANRRDKILPFEAADQDNRLSPVEATARYLRHIKEAWNHVMAQGDPAAEFESQEIILTVPASFDEVARTLTVEAAKLAGFIKMTLLEEPQAAFYSWIAQHENVWEQQLHVGETILVCDVGGGTTDFSLLEVVETEGKLGFQRMAVGDHLLLGGDNMDAALTHYLEEKLRQVAQTSFSELSTTQWLQLRHQARYAKEMLLTPTTTGADHYKVILQGAGSGVISGSLTVDITREEVQKVLVDGFFGQFSWEEAAHLHKARGLRTMGLPYEDDPSITKHLARFLRKSSADKTTKAPNYILFNGGVMKAPAFQKAVLESFSKWFSEKTQVLPSYNLDLAVARGAAYYGKVRRGLGVRIGGGVARGYYIAIEVKDVAEMVSSQALTLLPRGSEEGCVYEPEQLFWLTPNTPVSFQLYASHVRLHDKSGDLIAVDPNEMQALPPIHTVLRYGKQQAITEKQEKIPVHICIELTAIGTIELWLKSQKTAHKWALEFQVRSASGQENSLAVLEETRQDEVFDANYLQTAKQFLQELFAGTSKVRLEQAMEHLETLLERPRKEWSISVLRGLADAVLQQASRRLCAANYEIRWWNLIGFFLRPGFGYALDDFRLKELWKIILVDIKTPPKSVDCQIQRWICYRRIAGGLNKGQQAQLANDLLASILNKKSGKIEIKGKADLYQYAEKLRVLGAFELLDTAVKTKLGNALVERIAGGEGNAADFWTLGRLGARHLMYGSGVNVVPSVIASQWIKSLFKVDVTEDLLFVLGQLARKTDHRELNIPQEVVTEVMEKFSNQARLQSLLSQESALSAQEQEQILGDRLPLGLTLIH
jgi:molecular chaperone DnaK (HSP70)